MRPFSTIICILVLSMFVHKVVAQQFEGEMKLERITKIDTTYYKYYVKGNKVRIDELDEKNNIEGIMLLDIKDKKVWALSPARKLFYEIPFKASNINIKNQLDIIKGKNKKTIAGFACEQWIVKNQSENTAITYWVAPSGYSFFKDFLLTLNRKDKIPTYFLNIDGVDGVMPMLTEEKTLLREEISKLEIISITKKDIPAKFFSVPENFQEFKRN